MVTIPMPESAKKKAASMVMHPVSRERITIATVISFAVLFAGVFIGYAAR